jgi:hypothetical protein
MDLELRRSILARATPFTLLTKVEQERLATQMSECFLRAGETVFEQGDAAMRFTSSLADARASSGTIQPGARSRSRC